MRLRWITRRTWCALTILLAACPALTLICTVAAPAYGQRVFGLDTSSAANTNVSQAQWNAAYTSGWAAAGIPSFQFAYIRSNHGIPATGGTDDNQFYQNISRATTAGMLAGSYNFIEAGSNTAVAEANHYLDMAGMYMKPGYLLPVFDLEGSNSAALSQAALTTWSNDYMNTILAAKGVYPIVYTGSSFNNDEVTASVAWMNSGTTPKTGPKTYQWIARPSGSLTTGEPAAATSPPGYPNPYGVWDPNFVTRTNSRDPAVNPWAFWQNGSDKIDPANPSTSQRFLVDFNAANGNMEFVKDFLVPALWTNAGSGDWGTTANWNSDNPDYVAGNTSTGPAPRLPNDQNLDWVKLQNAGDGTVTISNGARTVRKFYTQQPLNITGGSLSVAYVPGSGGQFDLPSEFNAAVTLSSGTAYSARTTQVDGGGGQFNINGGTVTFTDFQLVSHASNSGKIVIGGDVVFAQTGGAGTSLIRSTGSLAQAGSVSLSAGDRTLTVNNGSAAVDVQVRTAVSGAGRLVKSGAGTMLLSASNSYSGGTTVANGVLEVTADNRLGAAPGGVDSDNIVLDGGTLRTGAQINSISLTNVGSNYATFPTMTINGAGADVLAASANVLGGIRTIAVAAGGSGYNNQSPSSPPAANTAGTFVDIVGGGGTGATAYATVSGGVVTSVTIANQGTGYTSMPTIHISSTGVDIDPSGTTQIVAGSGATASVSGITLQSITLNDGGFDYTTPTISLTGGGGSGATATAASTPTLALPSNRGITLGASGGTLYQTAGTTLTVGGIIASTGNGTLNKSGAGTLVLNGANTYTGATAINSGTLRTGSAERIPDGSAVTGAGGSTFDLQNNNETIGSLAGSGNVTNISLLDAGGDNTSTTFSGVISGNSLRKSGAGKLSLAGSNSYSGGTNILGGTLSGNTIANLGTNSNFGTGNFSIANAATLEYTGFSAGSTNRSVSLGASGGIVSVLNGSLTVSGVIDGSALTKSGLGTLTLPGTNTYTGGTTVSAGILSVATAAARLGTGNVTVQGTTSNTALAILSGVSNAIDDSATLDLLGGGDPSVADQGYADLDTGINEVINSLFLAGAPQMYGLTYGSTDSSAVFQSDEYFAGAGLVSVGLLGDFNNDNSVDAGDYVVWQKSPSTYGGSPGYDLWRANFGNTFPGPGSGSSLDGGTIPEPSSFALLTLGLATLAVRRRGR